MADLRRFLADGSELASALRASATGCCAAQRTETCGPLNCRTDGSAAGGELGELASLPSSASCAAAFSLSLSLASAWRLAFAPADSPSRRLQIAGSAANCRCQARVASNGDAAKRDATAGAAVNGEPGSGGGGGGKEVEPAPGRLADWRTDATAASQGELAKPGERSELAGLGGLGGLGELAERSESWRLASGRTSSGQRKERKQSESCVARR